MVENHNTLQPSTKGRRGRWCGSSGQPTRRKRSDDSILDASEISIQKLTYLNSNKIYWIRSRSRRHFVCQACGIPLPSLGASMRHSNQSSHDNNLAMDSVRPILLHLPDIAHPHREVLNGTLEATIDKAVADLDEVHRRQMLAEDLMTALRARIPNLKIIGIGSTWDGLTLVNSSVELNVDRTDFLSESSLSADLRTENEKPGTVTSPFDSFSHSPGLGYLLAEVFNFLQSHSSPDPASTTVTTATQHDAPLCKASTVPPGPSSIDCDSGHNEYSSHLVLPEIHSVTHTNIGSFCITFFDSEKVLYRIITGNSRGHHLSKLISTYFSLNHQARKLAIVFLYFSSIAHIDLPQVGTFYPPVLPLLVIFYLQHTDPPLLPNLHQMYQDHKGDLSSDAFYHVVYNELDLSFVTDASFVFSHWTCASDNSNDPDLADLWLGLLRFYVFDFQKSKCAVNIVSPNPVPRRRGSGRTSSISVMDPFDPSRDMCSPVNSNGFEYVHAQLLAAYAYFGVPRLDDGRHLFTKIRTRESEGPPVEPYFDEFQPDGNKHQPTTSTTKQELTGPIRLTPVIDDGDQFESNLTKCLLQYWNCQLACSSPSSPAGLSANNLFYAPPDSVQSQPADCEVIEDDHLHEAELDTECVDMSHDYDVHELCANYDLCTNSQLESQDAPSETDQLSNEEYCDFAEQTLDLGDDDDVEQSDRMPIAVVNESQQNALILQPNSCDKLMETTDSCIPVTKTSSEFAGVQNQVPSPCSGVQTCLAAGNEEPTTSKKRKKRAKRDSLIKKRMTDTDTNTMTWETVIMSRDSVSKPLDDTRPGYYNARLVNSLRKEELSFPFESTYHVLPPDYMAPRTSVLGLVVPGKPSTMLAHFLAPLPQCKACGQLGHCQSECAAAADKSVSFSVWKRLINDLPAPASEEQQAALSETLLELSRFHDCTYQETKKHFIVEILQSILSKRFPTVRLQPFGSCANGFELLCSDLDLCVFFPRDSPQSRQLMDEEFTLKLIREFRTELYRSIRLLQIVHVRAILHAKVPILKVRFENGFEVDISFSNYLALMNTRMLKLYTVIDSRLRVLGIALKIIGKLCHIGNASVGGVSSYAFIIMLIHYLQQKDQLPVLQELYEGSIKPVYLINGWDAWFQEDLSVIRRLWTPSQNRMSLGELWLGFFRYFLFEFDRDVNVVSIRQKKVLPRFVKMWDSLFAVEDPFNLDHNLTGSLRRDSLLCILDVFYAVLVHHTTTLPDNMPLGEWRFKLFSPSCLATKQHHSPPPRSKCQRCHEFGHRAADCPLRDRKNCGMTTHTADSYVDILVGHFLAKDPRQSDCSPYFNRSPLTFSPGSEQVVRAQAHETFSTSVNHRMSCYSHGSTSSPNVAFWPSYPVFPNHAPLPRPTIVHFPHWQPSPGQTFRPMAHCPRVPSVLTAHHASTSHSAYPVSHTQSNNPQPNHIEVVNIRHHAPSPRIPSSSGVRMHHAPTVRVHQSPVAPVQRLPVLQTQQEPSVQMHQSSAINMPEPKPNGNIKERRAEDSCLENPPSDMPPRTALPDGSHATESETHFAHHTVSDAPNHAIRKSFHKNLRRNNKTHHFTPSNSRGSHTAQKTRVTRCFTRSMTLSKTPNPPDVDLSIRFQNMSTHPNV